MSRSLLCHAGEIWPGKLTAEESVFPVLKRDGLSFVLIMDDPVEVEISGVCHGLVRYGVTEKQNIPFVFISFAGALLDVDCYINLLREPADVQDAFTGNEVTVRFEKLGADERRITIGGPVC